MTTSSFSSDDFRAAAEVHAELPADYRDAVVESFLDKIGREIDARVDARVDGQRRPQPAPEPAALPKPARTAVDRSLVLPIISMIIGIPLTAMTLNFEHTNSAASFGILLLIWTALVAINVAHSRRRN